MPNVRQNKNAINYLCSSVTYATTIFKSQLYRLQANSDTRPEVRSTTTLRTYYASRLSVARGKFRAQVLPLKPSCCHWQQRLFPVETSCGIDVICIKRANEKAAIIIERKDFCQWLCLFARLFAKINSR